MVSVAHIDVSFRGFPPNEDTDIIIDLELQEVNLLSQETTKIAITAFLVANIPVVGVIVAQFVLERIEEIEDNKGPNGTRVELTIRNGTQLHVFKATPR